MKSAILTFLLGFLCGIFVISLWFAFLPLGEQTNTADAQGLYNICQAQLERCWSVQDNDNFITLRDLDNAMEIILQLGADMNGLRIKKYAVTSVAPTSYDSRTLDNFHDVVEWIKGHSIPPRLNRK